MDRRVPGIGLHAETPHADPDDEEGADHRVEREASGTPALPRPEAVLLGIEQVVEGGSPYGRIVAARVLGQNRAQGLTCTPFQNATRSRISAAAGFGAS